MTMDTALFLIIICTLVMTAVFITTDKTTPEERDEMLKDEDMWP